MKTLFSFSITASVAVFFTTSALAQNVAEPVAALPGNKSITIYRQVMPDGSITYSDKATKGARTDETITVEAPSNGNLWTTRPTEHPPKLPQQVEHTKIIKAPTLSFEEKRKIADQVESSVIRAEMLLEDAKRKQEDGVEPLPGERTGNVNGTSRLNEKYWARQRALAKGIAYAQKNLERARERQEALR
jgi:hypothetical protein